MAVRFAIHETAYPSIARWHLRQAAHLRGARELLQTFLDGARDELIRTAGRPEGAVFVERVAPPLAVWEVQFRQTWLVYANKREGGVIARLLGRGDLRILLLRVYSHAPSRTELETLRRSLSPRASRRAGGFPPPPPG